MFLRPFSVQQTTYVPDWQPRTLLGMVEARSVNAKKTTTTTPIFRVNIYIGSSSALKQKYTHNAFAQNYVLSYYYTVVLLYCCLSYLRTLS